jgi:hypothetical protein
VKVASAAAGLDAALSSCGLWIGALLLIGGYALDRVLSRGIVENFDQQLGYVLNAIRDQLAAVPTSSGAAR